MPRPPSAVHQAPPAVAGDLRRRGAIADSSRRRAGAGDGPCRIVRVLVVVVHAPVTAGVERRNDLGPEPLGQIPIPDARWQALSGAAPARRPTASSARGARLVRRECGSAPTNS